jgi:hypothetical protein
MKMSNLLTVMKYLESAMCSGKDTHGGAKCTTTSQIKIDDSSRTLREHTFSFLLW